MLTNTKYFGKMEYVKEDILFFDDGLFGFEDQKEYVLIHFEEEDSNLLCLQSLQEEALAFVLINPFSLKSDYHPELSSEDMGALGLTDSSTVSYYAICVVHDTAGDSTVNLKCPLVINVETRHARQVILETSDYTFRHKLCDLSAKGEEGSQC